MSVEWLDLRSSEAWVARAPARGNNLLEPGHGCRRQELQLGECMSDERENPQSQLTLDAQARQFFREFVGHAMETHGIVASEASELYLTDLLTEHASAPRSVNIEQPLAVRLAKAMDERGGAKFEKLRALGDDVLFLSGFFAEHLQHRGLQLDYVTGLGQIAYGGAASVLRHYSTPDSLPVFDELADKFRHFVTLLQHVADSLLAGALPTEHHVLSLYEKWARTRSKVLAMALMRLGVSLNKPHPSVMN